MMRKSFFVAVDGQRCALADIEGGECRRNRGCDRRGPWVQENGVEAFESNSKRLLAESPAWCQSPRCGRRGEISREGTQPFLSRGSFEWHTPARTARAWERPMEVPEPRTVTF